MFQMKDFLVVCNIPGGIKHTGCPTIIIINIIKCIIVIYLVFSKISLQFVWVQFQTTNIQFDNIE